MDIDDLSIMWTLCQSRNNSGIVGDSDIVPDRRHDFFFGQDPARIPEKE
jgi:hypothetical protein